MYGLIGKMLATPGKREELLAILMENNDTMPGCLSYIIARDPASEDGIAACAGDDRQGTSDHCRVRRAVRNRAAGRDRLVAGVISPGRPKSCFIGPQNAYVI
jgi:hypothetical protein